MSKTTANDQEIAKALQKLAGSKVKGQQLGAPWLHPFPARMPLSVAEYLIDRLTTPEALVLDPMAGSGTTLLAAKNLGRSSLGFDRDPLAILIARSITERYEFRRLDTLRKRISTRAKEVINAGSIELSELRAKLPQEDQAFIQYWFPRRSQKQLFALAASIEQESESAEQDLAWVIFSSLIIAKSAGASFALDISRSRPHKVPKKPIVFPFDGWDRRFISAVKRLPFVDTIPPAEGGVHYGDARGLPLEDGTVDFILTSPPYRNAIDYLRSHKFSLVWMGHRLKALRDLRGTMIGTERGLWSLDGLPPHLEQRMEQVVEKDRYRAHVRQYLSDLCKILGELERILRPGGLALLIMGPTVINSKRSDSTKVVADISNSVGLRVVGSVIRQLNKQRRSLPLPPTVLGSPLAQRMRREVIVALRK